MNTLFNKKYIIIFKTVIAILMLTILLHKISIREIYMAFVHAKCNYIISATILLFPNLYFQFKKWSILVKLETTVGSKQILYSLLIGFTLGFITPGRVGEYGRGFFIKKHLWSRFVGLTLLEKMYSLVIIYILGIVSITYFISQYIPVLIWLPVLFLTLIFLFFLVFFLLKPVTTKSLLQKFNAFWKKHSKLEEFIKGVQKLDYFTARKVMIFAFLHVITYLSQLVLLINAFSPIKFINGFIASAAIMMTKSLLPISIGDLGIRESIAIFYFNQFDISQAGAFNASMLLFAINLLIPSITGMFLILSQINNNNKPQ